MHNKQYDYTFQPNQFLTNEGAINNNKMPGKTLNINELHQGVDS